MFTLFVDWHPTLIGTLKRAAGENVGKYTISQGALANSNYIITFNNGIYTITEKPTLTPVETKETKEANKVVAAIANTAAVKVAIPKITQPVIQPQARPVITSNVNLGFGEGAKVNLISKPLDGEPTKVIKLSEIKAMQPEKKDQNGNPVVQDTRVALSDDSVIDLINDGVYLPDGVEQEFYVVEDKRN